MTFAQGVHTFPHIHGIRQFADALKAQRTTGAAYLNDPQYVVRGEFDGMIFMCYPKTTVEDIVREYERRVDFAHWLLSGACSRR